MNKIQLQNTAEIIPNESLGGISLRVHISELEHLVTGLGTWKPGNCQLFPPFEARYSFGNGEISISVDIRNGKIFKIIAGQGYKGKLFNKISVGMPISQAIELEPGLYYDEVQEIVLCSEVQGFAIDLPEIDPPVSMVPGMKIYAINVYAQEAFIPNDKNGNW